MILRSPAIGWTSGQTTARLDRVAHSDPPDQPNQDQPTRLRARLAGLQRAMAFRAVIEQAVGLLAGAYGTDPETAFGRLVRLSQHHNIKLRRMAAVLMELTAEAGPATAEAVVNRLDRADPLVALATERNRKRGYPLDRELPGSVIEAARELVAAYDATSADADRGDSAADGRLREAQVALGTELVRLGWVPPLPVPAELAEAIGRHLAVGQNDKPPTAEPERR